MFSLLYGFWQYLSRRPELNVLILGLDGAGKTTLLERVKQELAGVPMPPPEKVRRGRARGASLCVVSDCAFELPRPLRGFERRALRSAQCL